MSDNQPDGAPEAPTIEPESGVDLETLKLMATSALTERMGIKLITATPALMVGTMPVEGNTQPYGLLHGGASCVLAETLGSVGAAIHAARSGKIALGIDLNATHHRSARAGLVTGTATAIQLGGSLASYEIVIEDDAARRICTARLTCMLKPRPST
jgi:1,4-dihydroxy-2-naphthoyl-CoA hydrolase